MRRKKWVMPLFGLEVLAICGAAIFMVKGVSDFYAEVKNGTSKEEETGEVQVIKESIINEEEAALPIEIEESKVIEKETRGHQKIVRSMNSDVEDAYLLEKIAISENIFET